MGKFKHKKTGQIYVKEKEEDLFYNLVTEHVQGSIHYQFIEGCNDWEEVKEPLFTTEDGVGIHLGDYYCRVGRPGKSSEFICWDWDRNSRATETYSFAEMNKHNWHFSSVEAAEEFILMNKPCLTVKDVEMIIKINHGCPVLEDFKLIAKSRING